MYQVINQPPPLEPVNLLETDAALREALVRESAQWAEEELSVYSRAALISTPS